MSRFEAELAGRGDLSENKKACYLLLYRYLLEIPTKVFSRRLRRIRPLLRITEPGIDTLAFIKDSSPSGSKGVFTRESCFCDKKGQLLSVSAQEVSKFPFFYGKGKFLSIEYASDALSQIPPDVDLKEVDAYELRFNDEEALAGLDHVEAFYGIKTGTAVLYHLPDGLPKRVKCSLRPIVSIDMLKRSQMR